MLKTAFALPLLLQLVLAPAQKADTERLRDIRTVFVADIGNGERARLLKEEIINQLAQSKRIKTAASADEADATLSITTSQSAKNMDRFLGSFGNEETRIGSEVKTVVKVSCQLATRRTPALWTLTMTSESYSSKSEKDARMDVARKLARELLKAIDQDRKKTP
ncbi:MAG: hypothetical protein AB1631_22650 [Acidobacteriota bacterium]